MREALVGALQAADAPRSPARASCSTPCSARSELERREAGRGAGAALRRRRAARHQRAAPRRAPVRARHARPRLSPPRQGAPRRGARRLRRSSPRPPTRSRRTSATSTCACAKAPSRPSSRPSTRGRRAAASRAGGAVRARLPIVARAAVARTARRTTGGRARASAELEKASPALRGRRRPQVVWGAVAARAFLTSARRRRRSGPTCTTCCALELVQRNPRYKALVLEQLALLQSQVGNYRIALGYFERAREAAGRRRRARACR